MSTRLTAFKEGAPLLLGFRDLEFARIPVIAHSSRGTPFTRMIASGMPRIPPSYLDCVVYLYPDEEKAIAGKDFGGTGFLLAVASRHPGRHYIYAVTNHHVAVSGGSSVVRVNTFDGGVDVFPFEPHEWDFDPKYDIAIKTIGLVAKQHKFSIIPVEALVTEFHVEKNRIGVGEDVFMVGRFVDHDGGPTNRPAVRFGNISVMPSPIEQPNGVFADVYCVDLHSRSGYSGSPVFMFRTPGFDLEEPLPKKRGDAKYLVAGANYRKRQPNTALG